jgi:hypothetical protein
MLQLCAALSGFETATSAIIIAALVNKLLINIKLSVFRKGCSLAASTGRMLGAHASN